MQCLYKVRLVHDIAKALAKDHHIHLLKENFCKFQKLHLKSYTLYNVCT